MLRHTTAKIETVGKFDMEPGNTYIIQHNKEGLKSIDPRDKNITPAQINDYNTRFKGKFVKYDIGKTETYPDGIPGITNMEVAVFEDVEIISTDKNDLTDDIYVIISVPGKPDRGKSILDLPGKTPVKGMLELIKRNKVAFGVNKWTFADAVDHRTQTRIEANAVERLVSDKTTNNLQDQVFRSGPLGTAGIIADYVGTDVLKKQDEVGGRRKSRRNKRGKTRKGKSRKNRTRKHRRHYRK